MDLPDGPAGPSIMSLSGRSYSDQTPVETSQAVDVSSLRNQSTSSHEKKANLKRACSFPTVVHSPASMSTATSTKPAFKIQLPYVDLTKLSSTFSAYRNKLSSSVARSGYPSSTDNQLDTPTFDIHACLRARMTPPITPPFERSGAACEISTASHVPEASMMDSAVIPVLGLATPEIESSGGKREHSEPNRVQGRTAESKGTELGDDATSDMEELQDYEEGSDSAHWLEEVLEIAVSELVMATGTQCSIKVVAQTLPTPIVEDQSTTATTAFPALINVLQSKLQASSTPYIQVTHAVPSSFALASLPTSPPSTPSVNVSLEAQEDYFSASVFSSAVAIVDRHDKFSKKAGHTPMPSSPCLAVPPASSDFGLLERYIPPSTVQEVDDLFLPTGPSALVDRLIELSPSNGTLLFIYPTRTGALNFTAQYLNPILDPVLRSVITSHCLSADIGVNISTMVAIEHLPTFEGLKRKLQVLLRALGRGAGSINKARYAIVHATEGVVHVERKVWSEWYVKQETPRIRHITTEYINRAIRLPQEEHVSYAVLTREIVEGLVNREYTRDGASESNGGIEVGIFVVRRGD